ncbi:hypothetical protein FTV88_0635 [Heliorestis convoluta]|uniref:Uncharacterized protein n=1 Tax=Heliorestis convoluta TaxID=356322 RepID=A0A5Q2MWF9_9FIRM|nr:hypothetical protein FTV88_0635 [Heliorestis convoluta]
MLAGSAMVVFPAIVIADSLVAGEIAYGRSRTRIEQVLFRT